MKYIIKQMPNGTNHLREIKDEELQSFLDDGNTEITEKEYNNPQLGSWVDGVWTFDSTAHDKAEAESALYATYMADVLAMMESTFNTNNIDRARNLKELWTEMAADPDGYATDVIPLAEFAVAGFALGDVLDTQEKVSAYANACLLEAKAYAKAYSTRRKQFYTDREVIRNG